MEENEPYKNHRLDPDEIPMTLFSHPEYLESKMDDALFRSWAEGKINEKDKIISDLSLENIGLLQKIDSLELKLRSYEN